MFYDQLLLWPQLAIVQCFGNCKTPAEWILIHTHTLSDILLYIWLLTSSFKIYISLCEISNLAFLCALFGREFSGCQVSKTAHNFWILIKCSYLIQLGSLKKKYLIYHIWHYNRIYVQVLNIFEFLTLFFILFTGKQIQSSFT